MPLQCKHIITAATTAYKFTKTKFAKLNQNAVTRALNSPSTGEFQHEDFNSKLFSAEYADKRWIKITRIRELRQLLPVGLYF